MSKPLHVRDGYEESYDHPLVTDLRALRIKHKLVGAVLITFDADRVGVDTSGETFEFGAAMRRLGDQILAAIDDGQFDPETGDRGT